MATKPTMICYSHFGMSEDAVGMLKTHKKQLLIWKKIIENEMIRFRQINSEDFIDRCLHRLLKEDPNLKRFVHMDEAVQERERGFLKNSIKGFTGYLQTVADNP
jgi:hypothetical protein